MTWRWSPIIIFPLLLVVTLGGATQPQAAPTFVVRGSVAIGSQPSVQAAVNPKTHRVYIAGSYAQLGLTVADVTNPAKPTVVTTVSSGGGVTVNPVTDRFYTSTSTGFGGILTYSGVTNTQIPPAVTVGFCGGNFAVDPTNNLIYMISQCGANNDPLHVLNGATNTIIAGPLGSGGVNIDVLFNSATGRAYVVNAPSNVCCMTRVFGPSPTFSVVTTLTGAVRAVNPVTNLVYIESGFNTGTIQVLDGITHTVVGTITGAGGTFFTWGVDTRKNRLYVPDETTNQIKVVDGATNSIIDTFTLGAGVTLKTAIAVDSTRHRIYAVGSQGGLNRLFVVHGVGITSSA